MPNKSLRILCISWIVFLSGLFSIAVAQDVHFTNYDFSPLYMNPGLQGHFHGTYRIGASYREQFSTFIDNPFTSPMLYVDAPVDLAFGKNDWMGFGMALYSDKVGDLGLRHMGALLGGAYHLGLDKNRNSVMTLGVQVGLIQRRLEDPNNARFADVIIAGGRSKDEDLLTNGMENHRAGFTDFNVGIVYNRKLSKESNLELGYAIYHLFEPDLTFEGHSVVTPIFRRMNVHARVRFPGGEKLDLEPLIYFSSTTHFINASLQMRGYLQLTKETRNQMNRRVDEPIGTLMLGIGYRIDDAAQLMLGYTFNDWTVALSYDLTVSQASNYNNSYGAIEIGASKIIKIYKEPEVPEVIFCPRL